MASPYEAAPALLKTVPVSCSMALTLLMTSTRASLQAYAKAVVGFTTFMSVVYLFTVFQGQIDSHFGRLMFFNGSHPNLGSEIGAAAIILACIFYRGWPLVIRLVILSAPLFLMQGRAAIVAAALAVGIHAAYGFSAHFRRRPATTVVATALAVPTAAYLLWGHVTAAFDQVMLVGDPYRGRGTDLVGRMDRWVDALAMIKERPLLGYSSAVFEQPGVQTPHDFFLYGFVNLGIPFLLALGFMAYLWVRAYKYAPRATAIVSSLGC